MVDHNQRVLQREHRNQRVNEVNSAQLRMKGIAPRCRWAQMDGGGDDFIGSVGG